MADVGSWDKIQQGVKETERLLNKKQNNLAMVKARQTLEYMVKALADRACIVEGDMADMIDQLYEGRWIDKSARDHYHKVRIIGNKAVHEGNDSPSDANLAYHIISTECYAFAPRNRKPANRPASSSAPRQRSGSANRKRSKKRKSPFKDFLRILIPIICILLLILLIRVLIPKNPEDSQPTQPPQSMDTSAEPTVDPSLPSEETPEESPEETLPPETTSAAPRIYKTTETLNVRAEPSTSSRILVQLAPGTEVNVVGTYDDQWTIINYDGKDVYVATAYLTQ